MPTSRLAREAVFWGPLLLAVALVALWPPHVVDGPAHVLGASVLSDWSDEPAYRRVYRRDLTPTPNLGGNLVLAVLIKLVGIRAGEALVLIACSVGLPLALRAAVAAVRPQNAWAAIAALPLGFGYLYFYGFYGFYLGVVLFLCTVAVALRGEPSPRRTLLLTALLTATWFTHLVPFAMAMGTVGLLALARGRSVRALALAAVPAVPGLALTLSYALRTSQGEGPQWNGPGGLVLGLLGLHGPIVALTTTENVVTGAFAVLLVGVAVWTRRVRGSTPGLALAAGAAVAVYLVAPDNFGLDFGFVNDRLVLFPVLLGLLWLLARPLPERAVATVAAGAVAVCGALLAVRTPELRRIDRLADEYATVTPLVARGSTLVAFRFTSFAPDAGRNRGADPIRHLSSLLAARTGSVDVGHYEAVFDYFPARFRPDADPRRALDPSVEALQGVPPGTQMLRTKELTEGRIGYVLFVGASTAQTPNARRAAAEFRDRLTASYERIFVTAPTGLVELWRSRSLG